MVVRKEERIGEVLRITQRAISGYGVEEGAHPHGPGVMVELNPPEGHIWKHIPLRRITEAFAGVNLHYNDPIPESDVTWTYARRGRIGLAFYSSVWDSIQTALDYSCQIKGLRKTKITDL